MIHGSMKILQLLTARNMWEYIRQFQERRGPQIDKHSSQPVPLPPPQKETPLNFPVDKNSGNGFVLPDRRTRKAVNKSRGHTNSVKWQSGYRGRRNMKEKKEGERRRMWF